MQQQRLYLALIGEGIKERQALSCNPFGGASDCITLPATSTYAEACGRNEVEVSPHLEKHPVRKQSCQDGHMVTCFWALQVDCVYNQEDAVDLTGDPAADLSSEMEKRCVAASEDEAVHVLACLDSKQAWRLIHAEFLQGGAGSAAVMQGMFQQYQAFPLLANGEPRPVDSGILTNLTSPKGFTGNLLHCVMSSKPCSKRHTTCRCPDVAVFRRLSKRLYFRRS